MNKKYKAILGILALAGGIALAVIAYDWLSERTDAPHNVADTIPQPETQQTEGSPTPDFTMYDTYGNEVRLSDFFGKPIVLNFWTTWCPACVREMPYFEDLYYEMGDEIHILKVNLLDGQRQTREIVDNFMADRGYNFPIFFDTGSGAALYGVRSIPLTLFINADGYEVNRILGSANADTLRRGLAYAGVR